MAEKVSFSLPKSEGEHSHVEFEPLLPRISRSAEDTPMGLAASPSKAFHMAADASSENTQVHGHLVREEHPVHQEHHIEGTNGKSRARLCKVGEELPESSPCCGSCGAGIMALVGKLLDPSSRPKAQNSCDQTPRAYHQTNTRRLLPNRVNSQAAAEYDIDEKVLGSGAFGSVRRVVRKQSGKERIMKTMLKDAINDPVAFKNEITIQADLDHPHICRIFDTFEDSAKVELVLEYCRGGDLFDAICAADHFTERDAHFVMRQVMQAVCYMHGKAIAHRDLKPENFLLKRKDVPVTENQIKVVDFGFASGFKPGQKSMSTKCGTPHYMAPEILSQDYFDEKIDVWSCGVILYLFLCGNPPFDGNDDDAVFKSSAAGKLDFNKPVWKAVKPTAKLCIVQMCLLNPQQRVSAHKVLQSPWLQDSDFAACKDAVNTHSASILQGMRKFQRHGKLKKAASYLVAHALPDEHLDSLRQAFEGMDTDGDGKLTLEELRAGIGEAGVDCPNFEELFRELDKESRGYVEWTEFLQAVANESLIASEEACWEAFKVLDKDNSNTISVEEVEEMLRASNSNLTRSEALEALQEADTNGDGLIDFQEFMLMMRGRCATKDILERQATKDSAQ